MASSTIHVTYPDGTPARGIPVRLGFAGVFINGITPTVYTDREGIAVIQHSPTGRATLFVDHVPHQFSSPGEAWVKLQG
jgi:hypothetical protein